MAASRLPEPGTEYGPCADPCEHTDCAAIRRQAAAICYLCGEPIGYGVRFYVANDSVHARCEEDRDTI